MKILIVGSGGREHALAWKIAQSPMCDALLCAPGNAGIAETATCLGIAADDVEGLVSEAKQRAVDLVVVGPEAPLVLGLVDRLEAAGILAFGPTATAAALEGSKGFMKDLCARFEIPTASYERFDEPDAAKAYIRAQGAPIVVKADGLAAGKGVILCRNVNEAFAAVDHLMSERAFGAAGDEIVIEAMLEGEEASFFALVDGERALALASAQDHKAAYDGDEGPNTGGMGAFSPAPAMTDAVADEVMARIIQPTIKGMATLGTPYKGVLYAGLMITRDGLRLLEYNVRFGDPECQPLMLRLDGDLLPALVACAKGDLRGVRLAWRRDAALVVVMAARGYPGPYETGSEIKGLEAIAGRDDVVVFHAGTKAEGGRIVAAGGRVLGITARGPTVAAAQKRAYQAIARIDWPQAHFRRDIGWRAVGH